jgi:hypothetical protein
MRLFAPSAKDDKVIARVDRLKKGLFGNAKALKDNLFFADLKFLSI